MNLVKIKSNESNETGIFRNIVERSTMINNDEYIIHSMSLWTYDEFKKDEDGMMGHIRKKLEGTFYSPYLVISRSVFKEEIASGLDCLYIGTIWDEKAPPLTKAIDGLQKMIDSVQSWQKAIPDTTLTQTIVHYIAYSYYDCLSGGMSSAEIEGCRFIIDKYKLDLSSEVYPGKGKSGSDEWYRLSDFMENSKQSGQVAIEARKLLLGD